MRLSVPPLFVAVMLLAFASPARADETVWNPFLFTTFCSTCGPQTPLTLEQADGVELLLGGFGVGPAIPLSPLARDDDFTPAPSGPVEGKPNVSLLPAAPAAAGGLAIASSAGSGNSNAGSSNAGGGHRGDSDDQENSAGDDHSGLSYGVDVGQGSTASDNVVTFTSNDGITSNVVSDTSGGGGQEGETLVPEPTTLLLFGTGLALVSTRLRRRKPGIRS